MKVADVKVVGVDDAGRGAAIGPLVIAGVLLEEKALSKLIDLGVKDSKLLSPRRREQLAEEIKELALGFHVEKSTPTTIDKVTGTGKKLHRLNRLEAQIMAKVVKVLEPDIVYVDASDVLADRFGKHIADNVPFEVRIISEHHADAKYPIVSAASIIAKVERDNIISELRKKHGDLGSGYPSDPKTIKFLENWIRDFACFPEFVRKSWKPVKKIKAEAKAKQTKLV
ncbi:MAG: ribonuclease HII [Candidatus Bathyarchaeota archaeon]|nr:MAG: ribonuclease HII [Candidatus Bathyarchaeota archaeon]